MYDMPTFCHRPSLRSTTSSERDPLIGENPFPELLIVLPATLRREIHTERDRKLEAARRLRLLGYILSFSRAGWVGRSSSWHTPQGKTPPVNRRAEELPRHGDSPRGVRAGSCRATLP